MPYVLALESIGDTFRQAKRKLLSGQIKLDVSRSSHRMALLSKKAPWCAQIVGVRVDGTLKRVFVQGLKSYEFSSGTGNRGVYYWFILQDGFYEVHEHISWGKSDRYFCRVLDGVLVKVDKKDLMICL